MTLIHCFIVNVHIDSLLQCAHQCAHWFTASLKSMCTLIHCFIVHVDLNACAMNAYGMKTLNVHVDSLLHCLHCICIHCNTRIACRVSSFHVHMYVYIYLDKTTEAELICYPPLCRVSSLHMHSLNPHVCGRMWMCNFSENRLSVSFVKCMHVCEYTVG